MESQQPAEGIMITKSFQDAKFFKLVCSCGDPDDEVAFTVELDETGEIILTTYTTPKTEWWNDPFNGLNGKWPGELWIQQLLNKLAHRIRVTWDVWTKGHVKYSQTTILSEQQAVNYASAIINAIEELNNIKVKKPQ